MLRDDKEFLRGWRGEYVGPVRRSPLAEGIIIGLALLGILAIGVAVVFAVGYAEGQLDCPKLENTDFHQYLANYTPATL